MPIVSRSPDERIAFATYRGVRIGSETRPIHAEGWTGEQSTGSIPLIAFSLLPIHVHFADESPIVLSPATVAMTTVNGMYHRSPASPRGQRSILIYLSDEILAPIVRRANPRAIDHPDDPFPRRYAPACPRALAMARQLERIAFRDDRTTDPIAIEECAIRIVERSLQNTADTAFVDQRASTSRQTFLHQRERVNHAICCLCGNPSKRWSLDELADETELSPAYLSRLFHAHTGTTITRALAIIRIAHVLEQLPGAHGQLTQIALSSGFGSHAHMSSVFCKLLSTTPSAFVDASPATIRETMRTLDQMLTDRGDDQDARGSSAP
ncbi:MAG: helix-turn-helix transcriptional regulator [Phycisphaerales bacterium]|nr:helix-turn-helix transcriptional regulator [Phycisphaerales bacterium]